MKTLLPGILLAAAVGCADGGMEIPTVELGGTGGARLMNGSAKSPVDAYERAFSALTRAHYNVRRNLEPRGQNEFAAREAMTAIIRCLEVMRVCVPDPAQPKFDPYLLRYRDWHKALENGTWGGSFLTEFERTEREIKTAFNPSVTEILVEFPGAKPAARPPADPGLSPDKVELPTAKNPAPADPAPAKPVEAPPVPPPAPGISPRLLYKAWSAGHDDLIAAYKAKQPCKAKYDDVVESLKLLKAQLSGEKATKLQIWIEYYGDISDKTKAFTALPEKTTDKDVVDELEVAARMIRKEFNPDK